MRAFFGLICLIITILALCKLCSGWSKEMDRMREMEKTPLLIDKYPLK